MDSAIEKIYINWTINSLMHHWKRDEIEPHLVNVISAHRGWAPLEVKEKMQVTFENNVYEIKRLA